MNRLQQWWAHVRLAWTIWQFVRRADRADTDDRYLRTTIDALRYYPRGVSEVQQQARQAEAVALACAWCRADAPDAPVDVDRIRHVVQFLVDVETRLCRSASTS